MHTPWCKPFENINIDLYTIISQTTNVHGGGEELLLDYSQQNAKFVASRTIQFG